MKLASGRYKSPDELIEQAVRRFLDERQRVSGVSMRFGESVRKLTRPAFMNEC
jgi:hypothetical protein